MTNSSDNQWRESSWRRPLTPAEREQLRGWLEAHPEARADWETELDLSAALERLPAAPAPGNFTARVLQAVERETVARERLRTRRSAWLGLLPVRWLPRFALAGVMLGAGFLSHHELIAAHRARLAASLVAVADVSSLPSPEILKDFEAVRALDKSPPADEELLALLK